jgi:predicted ATPase with chaperone activity
MKLGAKGEKKKNMRCQLCGIADGHNSRTRLNNKTTAPQWNETSTAKKHRIDEEVENEEADEHMELDE